MLALVSFVAATAVLGIDPDPRCTKREVKAALPRGTEYVVLPGGPRTLVATQGRLLMATCGGEGGAMIDEVRVDPPIDYRDFVALPNGRLVFGSTGGLLLVNPVTLAGESLTVAPPWPAATCWAGADTGEPVPAWDRSPRAVPGSPTSVLFERGGPCGYEAAPTSTTMVVDIESRAVRPARNVAAILVAQSGIVLIGDGAIGCDETQTRGTVYVSFFGGGFVPIPLDPLEPMGVIGLAETVDKAGASVLWALTGTCDNGGARRGGNLWRGGQGGWQRVDVPRGAKERGVDQGQGLVAIRAERGQLFVGRPRTDKDRLAWYGTKDAGSTWRSATPRTVTMRVPATLPATLGVARVHALVPARAPGRDTWAATSDGAFVQKAGETTWTRRFPGPVWWPEP